MRRVLIHLWVAFFLLFAQQAGFLHGVEHLAGGRAPLEKQLPHSDSCERCLAHAPLSAGAAPSAPPLPLVSGEFVLPVARTVPFAHRHPTPARSRSPPLFA